MPDFSKNIPFLGLIVLLTIITGCGSSSEFSGFSYDPEGATITTDKEIQPQHKRTIGITDDGVWISNEFEGARMNDFYQLNDSLYRVEIAAENYPINNSPWYAFKIWSDTAQSIDLQLTYKEAEHRYVPELSRDGNHWHTIDSTQYRADTLAGTATLSLDLSRDTLWVAAQELKTNRDYRFWLDSLQTATWVRLDTVGFSHDRRPIVKMTIDQAEEASHKGVLIITGRLHPPEVTGAMASQIFIEELTSETPLARKFRKQFEVWTYPLANPDGVARGHWRHNAAGVDLNRDWKSFNQPETQAIRNDLLSLKNDSARTVFYGIDFHSTNENIFYPINREIKTFPEDFTYQWIDSLRQAYPDYPIEVEPFDTSSPITKNWIYRTFGADAVTYELNDTANRDSLKMVTQKSARLIMEQLLEAKKNRQQEPQAR